MDDITVDFNHEEQMKDKLFTMEWTREHENILVDWADKAMCYRWLHSQATAKFQILSRWFTIPVIIISTLTGTANFAQDRVPVSFVDNFVMIVGALNLIAGIISTIQQFLKINELNEAHRVSSISWDKFYRNIKIELAKKPDERIPVGQMIKMCKEEFDRLMETSPVIQRDIITKFNLKFKDNKNFIKIKKPEICDELVSTDEFRYIEKKIKKTGDTLLTNFITKAKQYTKYKEAVEVFIDQFNTIQGRKPLKSEVIEGLMENNTNVERLKRAVDVVFEEMNNTVRMDISDTQQTKNRTLQASQSQRFSDL